MGHGRLRVWLIALARPARRRQASSAGGDEQGGQAERFLRCIRYSGAVVR